MGEGGGDGEGEEELARERRAPAPRRQPVSAVVVVLGSPPEGRSSLHAPSASC